MTISAAAGLSATALTKVTHHGHGQKKLGVLDTLSSSSDTNAASTRGATPNLLTNLFTAAQSIVGAKLGIVSSALSAISGATGATGAAATTAVNGNASTAGSATANSTTASGDGAQKVRGFLHSLFQALRTDGTSGSSVTTATHASASSGAGQYQGSLASSLQNLIGQLQSGQPTTPATAKLEASYAQLNGATSGSAASAASHSGTPPLTDFLSNLLNNVRTNGGQSINLVGSNVNTKV